MPAPAFRTLTYRYRGDSDRRSMVLTLVTNQGAHAELTFLNYLNHGINPGRRTGFGDLLTVSSVSSNTLPRIRTILHLTNSVQYVKGRLFPLELGNCLELRLSRQIELQDTNGIRIDMLQDQPTMTLRVREKECGYEHSMPPVTGDVFVIEQIIQSGRNRVIRDLYFSPSLGACVRVVERTDGTTIEAHLTQWQPLR